MASVSSTSTTSSTSSSSSSSSSVSTSGYSDFNAKTLVEAKMATRYARVDKLNTEVSENTAKVTAYQDMQTKLQSVTTALEALRGNPSSLGRSADVFRDRATYLKSSDGVTASSYMSASVEEGTEMGSHSISITQVAQPNILSSTAQSSKSDALNWSGTFNLGTDAGTTAEISVNASMSLADVADAINAEKDTSGVKASVMMVSEGSYKLVLTSMNTGESITGSNVSGTLLSDGLGILGSDGKVTSDAVLQKAQSAVFTLDGVQITRKSNDIDDAIDGVTLHLYTAPSSADTKLTLEVDNDLASIEDAVKTFVTAYNSFRDFVVANQTTTNSGTADASATLFGDFTLRSVANTVQSILTSSVSEHSLREIGITFDDENKLEINTTTLENKLTDNLDAVQSLFSYKLTASSGDLGLVRHPDTSLDFTLDVAVDVDGKLSGATVNGDATLFTVNGGTIKGVEGTIYEGLTMVYTGTTAKSIKVNLSQGIADQLYSKIDEVANEKGTLATQITDLNKQNSKLSTSISLLEQSNSSYSEALTTLYANMASKISTATLTVELLKALLKSDTSSS